MNDKENNKEIIARKVNEVLPNLECPMCHNRHFTILDGYLVFPVPDDYKTPFFQAQKSMPAIAVICTKCGFISQHALGILGLLYKDKQEETKKQEGQENKAATEDSAN